VNGNGTSLLLKSDVPQRFATAAGAIRVDGNRRPPTAHIGSCQTTPSTAANLGA